jgi:Flp pilus assembly protein CpaB
VSKRSTVLIVIGVAVFILGAGLVVVSLHTHSSNSTSAEETASLGSRTPVVVVTSPVAAGTSGETLIESKAVALQQVPAKQYSSDDLTSMSALEGQTIVHALAPGTPLSASDLSADAGPLAPPAGDESIALTLGSAQSGLAGYLQPGDNVDIWGNVIKTTGGGNLPNPCVSLVAPKVEVLDVSDVVPAYRSDPSSTCRTVPTTETVLVAVTPQQAPALVFYASNEQLYLVASGQTTVPPSSVCAGILNSGAVVPVP